MFILLVPPQQNSRVDRILVEDEPQFGVLGGGRTTVWSRRQSSKSAVALSSPQTFLFVEAVTGLFLDAKADREVEGQIWSEKSVLASQFP